MTPSITGMTAAVAGDEVSLLLRTSLWALHFRVRPLEQGAVLSLIYMFVLCGGVTLPRCSKKPWIGRCRTAVDL